MQISAAIMPIFTANLERRPIPKCSFLQKSIYAKNIALTLSSRNKNHSFAKQK